ncbi:MAG: sulfatase-like hydrolase/transferase [Staphylococcus equorum]|nr:sulfatase-like hydrolase/transferase [Staphylococcus equorum]
MNNIVLISKDALNYQALPVYGNTYWKTPNIDELALKGTVLNRHYTAAASTAMAFTSMAIGDYCCTTNRKYYKNEEALNGSTIFDKLHDLGYECHIVWDSTYTSFAKTHFRCEGIHTKIHSLDHIKQTNTVHIKGKFDDNLFDDEETSIGVQKVLNELNYIKKNSKRPVFIWLHLPHVMRGRQGYGSDIDVFDIIIGGARSLYGDDEIFISADHGHMNGSKNKYHYGYDLEDDAIKIPLITPRIDNRKEINYPTSSIQMFDILYNRQVPKLEYIISETAYYAQPKRKMAVIKDNYKYIYSKEDKKEFLYDLDFDKEEKHNLAYPEFYDVDRFLWYSTVQCFYYPDWDLAIRKIDELRKIKDSLWKNGNWFEELYNKLLHRIKCLYTRVKMSKPGNDIVNNGK